MLPQLNGSGSRTTFYWKELPPSRHRSVLLLLLHGIPGIHSWDDFRDSGGLPVLQICTSPVYRHYSWYRRYWEKGYYVDIIWIRSSQTIKPTLYRAVALFRPPPYSAPSEQALPPVEQVERLLPDAISLQRGLTFGHCSHPALPVRTGFILWDRVQAVEYTQMVVLGCAGCRWVKI